MIQLSFTNEHIKSLTRLGLFEGTTAELFRFLLKSKRVLTDKLSSGYYTRCVINGARNNENAADTASVLILDGDSRIGIDGTVTNGAVNPQHVHLILNHLNIDHFMYTSHSHDVGLNKYRVIIPCQYTREQLPALLTWIFERMHENGIDLVNVKENSSWPQGWFLPSVHPERQHLFKTWWRVGGKESNPMPSIEFEPAEEFNVDAIWQKHTAMLIPELPTVARVPMANLSANPIEVFNTSYSVHDVLIRNGYKQIGKRYLHPNSASKIAGVRILDTGRAYSDSSDSLNDGKSHDAFDCYRLLECGGDMKTALQWNSDITRANQRAFYELPDKQKPRDITIGAAHVTGVKYASLENSQGSQNANSIG